MNRREFLTAGAALSGAGLALGAAPAANPRPAAPPPVPPKPLSPTGAFDVGDRAQLFIDQFLVSSSHAVSFTQHAGRKHPANPLMKADRPWEGWRISSYGTVLYDEEEKIFKMWYEGDRTQWFPDFVTLYATSQDGVHWEKPLVGTEKCEGLPAHNAVLAACMEANVIKDTDEPDPARRYKMVAWDHRKKPTGGPHALVSPDGLNWTRISTANLFRSSDVVTAFYDRERKLFVALPKLSTPVRGVVRRCFGVTTSPDLLNWTEPRLTFQPDRRDDAGTLGRIEAVRPILDVPDNPALMRTEFYGIATYQAESCVVAFPWVFSVNNNSRFPTAGPFNHDGCCEVQLGVSRDLETWERPFRTSVIPLGAVGEWDSGFLVTASRAFRHADQVWLYYGGINATHGNPVIYDEYQGTERGTKYTTSIGLVTWPLDRFVSADAGSEPGTLTTIPLHFTGSRLELNLDASRGSLTVELLDGGGKPLPGFGKSDPLTSDSLRATVTWNGSSDLRALAGRPVAVRFEFRNAELYSFCFRSQ